MLGIPRKKAAAAFKTAAAKPTTPDLVVPTPSPTFPLLDINDLLNPLPFLACVELTCKLLISIASVFMGAARPESILKTVILFAVEFCSTS